MEERVWKDKRLKRITGKKTKYSYCVSLHAFLYIHKNTPDNYNLHENTPDNYNLHDNTQNNYRYLCG